MRPPSYYTSPAYASSSHATHSALPNSSQQLRSSFSSPTSATYASRTHLPFVAQSALVAHCISSGSSTRPLTGYGGSTSARSRFISTAPSSSSSSGSSRSSSGYHSTSSLASNKYLVSSRPPSTKRSPASAYLSASPASYTALSRPSYLSTQTTSSRSTYRPNSSSYYKPIRLRERPLLNQLQVRLSSTTRSPTPNAPLEARDASEPPASQQDDEKTWQSDVTRNISRNKYLIKFREFDSKAQRLSITGADVVEPVDSRPDDEETAAREQSPVRATTTQPADAELKAEQAPADSASALDDPCPTGAPESRLEADCDTLEASGQAPAADCDPAGQPAVTVDELTKPATKGKTGAPRRRNVKLKLRPVKKGTEGKRQESADIEQSVAVESAGEVAPSKQTSAAPQELPGPKQPPEPERTSEPEQQPKATPRVRKVAKASAAKSPGEKLAVKTNAKPRKVLAPKQPVGEPEPPGAESVTKDAPAKAEPQVEAPETLRRPPAADSKRIRFREYNFDDFNFLTVLGHGGWGFVVLAELKEHEACFAVKCIKKITIVEDDDFESILIERKVLALGNLHPFICKLFCTFETEGYLFFVMEYCAGGDLMFHVQREGKFAEPRCRFYAAEIICAIRFLHNRHIIYRDLKLDNILLDARGHVRLVDFGMCQCRSYREEMLPSNFCGTPEYISPEIIKGVPYNHSVDWWSFGVLLYEMAVGKMPFRGSDENELLWNVCYEQIHYPMFLSKELTSLLQSLLEREPAKRMGMATCKAGDIQDQAFFRALDWRAVEELRVEPPFVPEVLSRCDVQNFDTDFTESTCALSPVDEHTLARIDQSQFQKFPYTNPNIEIFDARR